MDIDTLVQLFKSYHFVSVLTGGIASIFLWKSVDFRVPGYIHVIALLAAILAIFLAYLGLSSGHPKGDRALWLIPGFPVSVYIIFGFYGGGRVMAEEDSKREKGAVDRRR